MALSVSIAFSWEKAINQQILMKLIRTISLNLESNIFFTHTHTSHPHLISPPEAPLLTTIGGVLVFPLRRLQASVGGILRSKDHV